VLRKCKVLAARLTNEPFEVWVERELNGFKGEDPLPDYRIVAAESKGHFLGRAGSGGIKNANIPPMCIPEHLRDQVRTVQLPRLPL
jgi:hypothetical protein